MENKQYIDKLKELYLIHGMKVSNAEAAMLYEEFVCSKIALEDLEDYLNKIHYWSQAGTL